MDFNFQDLRRDQATDILCTDKGGLGRSIEAQAENHSLIEFCIKNGKLKQAFTETRKLLSLNPYDEKAIGYLATLLKDKPDELEKLLKIQIKSDNGFSSLSKYANFLYRYNRDAEAFDYFTQALSVVMDEDKNELFEVYKNYGNLLVKNQDFDGAEEFYCKAFELNPNSDHLLVNLGTLSIQKGDIELAGDRFRAALQGNPKNDKAWVGLAIVHHQKGDHDLAKAALIRALDLNPENKTAIHFGVAWSDRHECFNWIELMSEYVTRVPQDEEMAIIFLHLLSQARNEKYFNAELERATLFCPESETLAAIRKEAQV